MRISSCLESCSHAHSYTHSQYFDIQPKFLSGAPVFFTANHNLHPIFKITDFFSLKLINIFFSSFWFQSENPKKIVFVFAIVACAVAIPAGAPQPRPIAPVQHQRSANPESEQLAASGAEDQDLKASSSYGYGYYGGGLGGYGGYGGLGEYITDDMNWIKEKNQIKIKLALK